MNVGIENYGVYIPLTRLPLAVIGGKQAEDGGPEKAVCWYDEDSLTMAVSAGIDCLHGVEKDSVDTVMFSTTSWSFSEKQGASVAAKALGLKAGVKSVDIGASLRSGTLAIQHAVDAVVSGSAKKVLVLAADCRMAAPKTAAELLHGDGAAAFLIGCDKPVAVLLDSASCANEMMDVWRRQGDNFVHQWEDRFINSHGYHDTSLVAVKSLFDKTKTDASDYQKVCLYAPDTRNLLVLADSCGFTKEQIQAPLFGQLGNTGTAFVPMLLVTALEQAKRNDRIVVVSYGDGADAFSLQVIAESSCVWSSNYYLKRRRAVDHYDKYLAARNLLVSEYPDKDDQGISATVQYRNRDENLSFQGQVCNQCNTHQFPKGRVCVRCASKDQWTPAEYASAKGRVITYTLDAFYPTPEQPMAVAIIEVINADGSVGPRIHMQFTDTDAQLIKIGVSVEFVFRVIHRSGKRPNYFWKCVVADNTRRNGKI
jgi:3-hydroxy-3-methylglutaryl CoA synthase